MYGGKVTIEYGDKILTGMITSIEFESISIGECMRGNVGFVVDNLVLKEQVTKKPEKEEYNWRYE